MNKVLTMTIIAVIGLAAYGCNKTEKINAAATNAQCNGSNCDPASCAKCPLAGTAECPVATATDCSTSDADKRARRARYQEASDKMLKMVEAGEITQAQMEARLNRMKKAMAGEQAKAKPAAAGNAKSCCANKAKAKPAAAGDAKSCCASKKAAVKPAATSSKNKADCNPSDCGSWKKGKKGSGSGCPFSGS